MRVATKPRFAVVFLMVLTLGLSVALLAEDVPETTYDESESAPYEDTPLFSMVAPTVAERTTQEGLSPYTLTLVLPPASAPARVLDTIAKRSADPRPSLALLRTLLC